jgi:plasmid maintenance system killer protein
MSLLNTATETRDLNLPGLHFEPLKHDRPGYNSIRVNGPVQDHLSIRERRRA